MNICYSELLNDNNATTSQEKKMNDEKERNDVLHNFHLLATAGNVR